MQVTVKLKEHSHAGVSAGTDLKTIAASLGAEAKALHPGTKDTNLKTYYVIEVSDRQSADRLIEALARSPEIDGAYVKPADALP